MANDSGRDFGEALKKLQKAGDAHPEWFDFARRVLREADSGKVLLVHALMNGLMEAHGMGLRKQYPAPELVAENAIEPEENEIDFKAPTRRVTRTAPVTTPKRIVRRS